MNLPTILLDGVWAGLFAMAMAVMFSTPVRALIPSFFCGVVARFSRDVLMGWGISQILATVIAAALVVITAAALVRRPGVSPIVVLSGLIPLGAAGAFFNAIVGFLRISSLSADALAGAPVVLVSNLSKVFTTTLAIAVGAWVGFIIAQVFEGEDEADTVEVSGSVAG